MPDSIGFIGAGRLGEPMVHRLLGAGHPVSVFVRNPDVRARLESSGATVVATVADLAAESDILISCLFSDVQLTELALGQDGILANARPGSLLVSHTTGSAATLVALSEMDRAGLTLVDAPVSGTASDIEACALTVLVGGTGEVVARITPVLSAYAGTVIPTGPQGSALAVKLINNLVFAANAQLLSAAVHLGDSLGIDEGGLLQALQTCSASSAAGSYVAQVGGMAQFEVAAAPFLRKDVAACRELFEGLGRNPGVLGEVVERGPMVLTDARGHAS